MNIKVQYQNNDQAITVQGGYYEDNILLVEWCDHAGYDTINGEFEQFDHDSNGDLLGFNQHYEWIDSCDKCGAWRYVGDEQWIE